MELLAPKGVVDNLIKSNNIVLLYFCSSSCCVCRSINPKITELLKKYPNIKIVEIEAEKDLEISAQYNVFTVPSIIMYIDGKEVIRESRYMSLIDLESKIFRYYNLYY